MKTSIKPPSLFELQTAIVVYLQLVRHELNFPMFPSQINCIPIRNSNTTQLYKQHLRPRSLHFIKFYRPNWWQFVSLCNSGNFRRIASSVMPPTYLTIQLLCYVRYLPEAWSTRSPTRFTSWQPCHALEFSCWTLPSIVHTVHQRRLFAVISHFTRHKWR